MRFFRRNRGDCIKKSLSVSGEEPETNRALLGGGLVHLYHLSAIVITAMLANAVSQLHFLAARALGDAGHGELPMRATTRIPSRLGYFSLRCGHSYTSSSFKTIAFNAEKGFATSPPSWHVQETKFRFTPHTGHNPFQSSLQRMRMGISIISASLTASVRSMVEASN